MLQGSICELKNKTKCELSMLKHVIEIQILDLVLRGVDLLVRILEVGLYHKGGWISILARRCMVRASISALGEYVRNVAVLRFWSAYP